MSKFSKPHLTTPLTIMKTSTANKKTHFADTPDVKVMSFPLSHSPTQFYWNTTETLQKLLQPSELEGFTVPVHQDKENQEGMYQLSKTFTTLAIKYLPTTANPTPEAYDTPPVIPASKWQELITDASRQQRKIFPTKQANREDHTLCKKLRIFSYRLSKTAPTVFGDSYTHSLTSGSLQEDHITTIWVAAQYLYGSIHLHNTPMDWSDLQPSSTNTTTTTTSTPTSTYKRTKKNPFEPQSKKQKKLDFTTFFQLVFNLQGPNSDKERFAHIAKRSQDFLHSFLYGMNSGDPDARWVHIDPIKPQANQPEPRYGMTIQGGQQTTFDTCGTHHWNTISTDLLKAMCPGLWFPYALNQTARLTVGVRILHNKPAQYLADAITTESHMTVCPIDATIASIQAPRETSCGWLLYSHPKNLNCAALETSIKQHLPPRYGPLEFAIRPAKVEFLPEIAAEERKGASEAKRASMRYQGRPQAEAAHIYVNPSAVNISQQAFSEILYPPDRESGHPLDRKYFFVPTVEHTPALRESAKKLQEVHQQQLDFCDSVTTLEQKDFVPDLDAELTCVDKWTVREFIMGIQNPEPDLPKPEPLFYSVDHFATDRDTITLTHKIQYTTTAKSVLNMLPVLMARAAGNTQVYSLFSEQVSNDQQYKDYHLEGNFVPAQVTTLFKLSRTFQHDGIESLSDDEEADPLEDQTREQLAASLQLQPENVECHMRGRIVSVSKEEWDRTRSDNQSLCSIPSRTSSIADLSVMSNETTPSDTPDVVMAEATDPP